MNKLQYWAYYNGNWHMPNSINTLLPKNANRVYEVLRIVNSKPLFLEDHFKRFEQSLFELGIINPVNLEQINSIIKTLILKNKTVNYNLRFELILEDISIAVYLVPFSYPSEEQYSEGVKLASFIIERKNPHIKQSIVNTAIRNSIKEKIIQEDIFEILLIDKNGNITEGSRSNVFFVKDNCLYSPPSTQILEGITRKKVLNIANALNIKQNNEPISLSNINNFQACFISGTSPKILPVSSINLIRFDANNEIIRQLLERYDVLIDKDCS